MRMEDLDATRSRPEHVDQALTDLEWLGLDWDGPVELQSKGIEHLEAAIERLRESGQTYPCICTRGDLRAAASAPHGGEPRYPGTCRGTYANRQEAAAESGRAAGLRFAVPDAEVTIPQELGPDLRMNVQTRLGDFIIARKSGEPAYQLAVVVDDARQEVTEVLRGADLLESSARQWHLQRALGLEHPRWLHVPLVVDAQGQRLAKRNDALSLATLRAHGVDPRAIVAWAAKSAGVAVAERCTAESVTASFDIQALPRTETRLDPITMQALVEARL